MIAIQIEDVSQVRATQRAWLYGQRLPAIAIEFSSLPWRMLPAVVQRVHSTLLGHSEMIIVEPASVDERKCEGCNRTKKANGLLV